VQDNKIHLAQSLFESLMLLSRLAISAVRFVINASYFSLMWADSLNCNWSWFCARWWHYSGHSL